MERSRLSRQELIRQRRRAGFVGRRTEIENFRANFTRSVEDPGQQFLFHVHGQAGVGKTSLIRQFEETAREQGAPTAYVDESAHTVPEAMAAISRQLAAQGHPLKVFDKLLATYRERRHEAEAVAVAEQGPPGAADAGGDAQGTGPSPGSIIAAQAGLAALGLLPGVGAVTGALDARQMARGADRLRGLLSARLRNHDDVELVMEPVAALTPVFVREVGAVADEVPWLALFFDTYERTGPLLDTWLRDVLVSDRYGPLAPNVVVTLAGQTALDHRCWADHLDCVAALPLDAFTEGEARQYLATRDIVDERIVEVILRLSGGLPVLVSTLAENRPGAAEAVDDPSDTAVERFLKWETDPVRREAALAAALPRSLDEDVFRTAVDPAAAGQFGWLCGLPFVTGRSGRRQYHEVVRTAMLRLQRRRSPQTWTARHRRLAEAARDRRRECADDNDPGRSWGDERWVEQRLRETYHALCADPRPALDEALADMRDAAEYEWPVVRRVAEGIRQAGEDADAPEVREWGERLVAACAEEGIGLAAVLTALLARPGLEVAEQARIHRIRGREYRLAEAWPQAFADFDRCLELTPRDAAALLERGLTHRYMRRFDRATEDYLRALEVAPDSVDAAAQLGEAYRLMGRFEEAVTAFDGVLARQPRHAFTLGSRAVCLRRLGRHDEALVGLARAIEINADYAWAMAERGATYRDRRQYALALAEFDRALEVSPAYVWAHARRGMTLRDMGRHEEALTALGRAAELRPDNAWVKGERCRTWLEMKRYQQALAEAERTLALAPTDAWARTARGLALRALGRCEEARAELTAALQLTPDSWQTTAARGRANLLAGRPAEALADFDRALATSGPNTALLALKAGCLCRTGNLDAAHETLEAARGALPGGRHAPEGERDPDDRATGAPDAVAAHLRVRYEEALLAGAREGVDAAGAVSAWQALRSAGAAADGDRDGHGGGGVDGGSGGGGPDGDPYGLAGAATVLAEVVGRCALGDWAGAEDATARLLDGAAWEVVAETELGIRDLARLPGANVERLAAVRDGLIRRMATVAGHLDLPG
ncbi:tetratricopeptide repeat protein [Streptomyces lydicus]|uniref:tetratricopeptide repeat protein n=1 Tax=Streptomyces lydicus TaxID=47763 RepID=UPI00378CDB7B